MVAAVPRVCAWCRGPIPERARRDAVTCSKRCRQGRHRFMQGVGSASPVVHGRPRRLAYADPPYPGRAAMYYGDHPDFGGEVDHAELVRRLDVEYDAWALSTAADALQDVLPVCPPGVRVAAWLRGERPNRSAQTPLNSWEPVIYAGAIRRLPADATRRGEQLDASRSADQSRLVVPASRDVSCAPGGRVVEDLRDTSQPAAATPPRVDSLVHRAVARTTDPNRVVGAKPAAFWRWLFELLGATAEDSFTDLFPASGGGGKAWAAYTGAVGHDLNDVSRPTVVTASTSAS
jgi:hypothetical protein